MAEYKDLPTVDVFETIKNVSSCKPAHPNMTAEELLEYSEKHPCHTYHHPLLRDYDWVYEHVEEILTSFRPEYHKQEIEEYSIFFKALTDKYSLEDDYNKFLRGEIDLLTLQNKWDRFACELVTFIESSFYKHDTALLEKDEIFSYFIKYNAVYTVEMLKKFKKTGIEKFLEKGVLTSFYQTFPDELITLFEEFGDFLQVPPHLLQSTKVISHFSRTPYVFDFYANLRHIEHQAPTELYLEEHKKYCDEQVANTIDGILPCLMHDYKTANDILKYPEHPQYIKDIALRIQEKSPHSLLTRHQYFQELSKYVMFGLLMSRYFETDPHNLLIDIETLYKFATSHNRPLKGYFIYEFLMDYEARSVFEIKEFYEKIKCLPLKEMFYDDWTAQKEALISEINSSLLDPASLELQTDAKGRSFYDITDITSPILVSNNATIAIDNMFAIKRLLSDVKTGKKSFICMSLQDGTHQNFYNDTRITIKTIKFMYGALDPRRTGIIHHEDAYSMSIDGAYWKYYYTRKMYALDDLLSVTTDYNEITYKIDGSPFLPIGILCEEEITESEYALAQELNVPIFFRRKRNASPNSSNDLKVISEKCYTNVPQEKHLFLKK